MNEHDTSSPSASVPLFAAALAGLMGAGTLAACSDDTTSEATSARPDAGATTATDAGGGEVVGDAGSAETDAGDAGTYNRALKVDANFSVADMEKACSELGGFVYVNSSCAGGAMCKGLSFHHDTLWEHSCRGQNSTCAGIGCVETPADTGLTGKQIYEDGPCGNCHGDWSTGTANYAKYAVMYYAPEKSEQTAMAEHAAYTTEQLAARIAWGASGFHANGTPYSNMDAYYRKYSAAEIRRVAAHVKTLTAFPSASTIFGVDAGAGMAH